MSEIDSKYTKLGGSKSFLGKPTSDETSCPDGVGRYRHYAHGSIYWHPLTGAKEVHGLIRAKWAKLGWERSFLGYPKSDESDSGAGAKGRFGLFQGGAITWKHGAKEAFETHGAIRSKFGQLGWEAGFLGFPTTDETPTPDDVGRYNHFEGGSIYWKPTISAHEVHGKIRQYWATQGWEKNPNLGYPISDELPTHEGSEHRFNDFENGVVYWKHGSKKAVALSKFVLGDASRTAAQIFAEIKAEILAKLKSEQRLYVKSGPRLAGVTDYSYDGAAVHNRLYRIHLDLGVDVPKLPDATSNLGLRFEVVFSREARTIAFVLVQWSVHTHVPWPTSIGLKAKKINERFEALLNPLIGVLQKPSTLPPSLHLLSAKVMPNGDLDVYVEPLAQG